ncbi:hypothetical protein GT347_12815 [Xylophilus rhododendri]|uniref:Transmembrane protein n=1 Tax=Xylophilus rhododendri TaxID=2697032 RepID=A0A857J4B7_9BURK|nr:hypothetical protein [Xylophilus rhododendri]QHI98794.1 hypothetical protein GT347_12815 [Xylophilus rhododendri]
MQRLRPAFLATVLLAVLLLAWVFPPDQAARRDTEQGLTRAVATYATARAIHAVLAVAQGTQVAVEPAGVGVVLAPGQALQPVSELVEQFSTLMLAACLAFGVQWLLLPIASHWSVSLALSLVVAAWALLRWQRRPAAARLAPLLVGLLLLRFGLPVIAAGNELVYRAFLAGEYTQAQAALGGTAGAPDLLEPTPAAAPQADTGWFGRWMKTLRDLPAEAAAWTAKAPEVAARARDIAAHAADHLLRLLAVFILQTVVIPLVFLWGLRRLLILLVGAAISPIAPRARS